MKKWIIILAITNAVTMIALSISITVIVMKDYLKGYDKAQDAENSKMSDEGELLKKLYLESLEKHKAVEDETTNSNITKNNNENSDKAPRIIDKKPKKIITKEMYENTDFQDRWRIVLIYFITNNPTNSTATLENMMKDALDVRIGTMLEKYKVIRITQDAVLFEDSYGIQIELSINQSPEWANQDIPAEKLNDIRKYQDPDSGNITPKSTDLSKNNKKTTKTESIIDEDGNVIVVPEGVDKETLLKQLKSKRNAKDAEEAKALATIPSEHHSLTPQTAYKIQENFIQYINEAVLENYYDVNKKKHDGILIVNFDDDSMYKKLGFKVNDIVTHINDIRTYTTFDLDNIFKTVDSSKGAEIQIMREGKPLKLIYDFSLKDLLDLEQKMLDAFKGKTEDSKESEDK